MILSEEEVTNRLESPLNLLNRLKATTSPNSNIAKQEAMSLVLPPRIDDLLDNVDDKLHRNSSRSGALSALDETISRLRSKLDEVDNPNHLAKIATDMSRVVSQIDNADAASRDGNKQLVIWQPIIVQENHYETINVND